MTRTRPHHDCLSVSSRPLLEASSGLYTARCLGDALRRELATAHRDGVPLSLLLIEGAPGFRRRLMPSSVRQVTGLLWSMARCEDLPARLRPRSFALLLPQTGGEAASRVARCLELELHVIAAGSGESWRIRPLSLPEQRDELERLSARPAGVLRLVTAETSQG